MFQRKMLAVVAAVVSSITLAETAGAEPTSGSEPQFQSGQASWYGPGFHGRRTASGEVFNTEDMTAAHRTLPFGTRVRVTNQSTGVSTVVRINDRGPYTHGRVIDLSRRSAEAIGLSGVASVSLARL
jgi:peptidoglycan lytic transglycosylase